MTEIGERIRELRQARGLSQEALAREADVSHNTVVRAENGRHAPTLKTLRKFADVLGVRLVNIVELIDDDTEPTS